MKVEVLPPSCNLDTVRDGRGGIFTWLPTEPILEFNTLYFRPGKIRGLHSHPHVVEYLLVVAGNGVLVTKDTVDSPAESEEFVHLAPGVCTRTPIRVPHTVYAITDLTLVAMLTKPWDECDPPVVQLAQLPSQED
jgi:mannose-6-phosphate isomerase-like protein (cupin superfamily)